MNQELNKAKNDERDWEQEFEDFGNEAVGRVKELVAEGNVRRLIVRKSDESVLLDVPLTPAIVVGAVMTFWMPYLVVLGVVAGFAAKLKVDVVHVQTADNNAENVEITS